MFLQQLAQGNDILMYISIKNSLVADNKRKIIGNIPVNAYFLGGLFTSSEKEVGIMKNGSFWY